jgi:PAS domain S-box-containing protein
MTNQLSSHELLTHGHLGDQERAWLKIIIDHMPEAVFIGRAPDGALVLANPAADELIGRLPENVPFNECQKYVDLQDLDGSPVAEYDRPMARALRGEEGRDLEYRLVGGDQTLRYVLANFGPLRSPEGEVLAGQVVLRDVSRSKVAEQRLTASEQRYRAFVSQSTEAIWCFELERPLPAGLSAEAQIQHLYDYAYLDECNDATARAFGFKADGELIGTRLDRMFPISDRRNAELIRSFLESGYRLVDADSRFVDEDGNVRHFLDSLVGVIEPQGLARVWGTRREMTERVQAEQALRARESGYRQLFENASDIIYTQDLAGNITSMNRAAEEVTGYTREEGLKLNIVQVVAPEHVELAQQMLARKLAGEYLPTTYELEIITKAGSRVAVELNTRLIFEEGKPVGVQGIGRNITARRQAEKERLALLARERGARNEAERTNRANAELLEREKAARAEAVAAHREWQATFDAMTDAVLVVDRDDRLIRANRAFYGRVGLPPEQCLGERVSELVHKKSERFLNPGRCPICEMRARGEHAVIEVPAGISGPFPVVASVDPVQDGAGTTVALVQVVRDLSDLYQARQEAVRERISLNATIEQMADGLVVWDENAVVVRANRNAQEIFGFNLEEMSTDSEHLLAENRYADLSGKPLAVAELPVQTALRRREVVDTRLWYNRPDGPSRLLSVTASPFYDEQNQLAGAIAIIRDITEEQRDTDRRQQADKLRALGQLASGVAHNFNNALAAVIGYTQLALPKAKDADLKKYLSVVEQAARDAARMVERIQNFSRSGMRKDEFIPLRLADVVRDAVDITRPRWRSDAEALGIRYDIKVGWRASEELEVNGQPSELREVFVNLIFNALDAMPLGGQMTIAAWADPYSATLTFTDTGSGMTEEIRRRIFEPFFTTKGVAGLGMGLSESYRIIERHSGRIEVESQPHRGTTFTITLPLALQPAASFPPRHDCEPPPGASVLVIDDEELVRNVLAEMLRKQGHEVATASSAREALQAIEADQFQVVFTDLAMPEIDGIAIATRIRSLRPALKIVLMSGYGAERAAERAAGLDCIDAAISKPFDRDEVNRVLKRVLAP